MTDPFEELAHAANFIEARMRTLMNASAIERRLVLFGTRQHTGDLYELLHGQTEHQRFVAYLTTETAEKSIKNATQGKKPRKRKRGKKP